MTKIEQEHLTAKQIEVEALKRKVDAMEAVNSALRLLAQAEDCARDATIEHAAALQRLVTATRDLTREREVLRDAEVVTLTFPDRDARA